MHLCVMNVYQSFFSISKLRIIFIGHFKCQNSQCMGDFSAHKTRSRRVCQRFSYQPFSALFITYKANIKQCSWYESVGLVTRYRFVRLTVVSEECTSAKANAKRPCDCCVLCLRLKRSLCSCAHSISDMTSFGCRDQGRDSVCPVLWMSTWRNSKSAGKRRA